MATQVDSVAPVDERIASMKKTLNENPDAEKLVPGLAELFERYLDPNVEVGVADFMRGLLNAFGNSPDKNIQKAFKTAVQGYSPDEKRRLDIFAKGGHAEEVGKGFSLAASPATRKEMKVMEGAPKTKTYNLDAFLQGERKEENIFQKIWDRIQSWFNREGAKAYENAYFQNWGRTIDNLPLYTFVPKTVKEVRQIVKFAELKKLQVRCSGYRHSWSPVFSNKGEILISMLDLDRVETLPDLTSLGLYELFADEEPLQSINFVDKDFDHDDKRLVRVGAAVTNEMLRRWCNKNEVSLPLNVIMVEITLGGSNAPICHGAGMQHKTLSDLVRSIEYVDVHGKKQTIKDPEYLKTASGCFGLLGVVTHITLEFDKLTVAKMEPIKLPVAIAVPPPDDESFENIPAVISDPWTSLSESEKKAKVADFEHRAEFDFYTEWFWFPFSDYSWVNCWNQTFKPEEIKRATPYPSGPEVFLQFVETVLMNVFQQADLLIDFIRMFDFSQPLTTIISRLAMGQLPGDKTIYAPVADALHFQRAIQNVRVRDMEVEMPIQPKEDDPKKPDFDLVRKAWWDAIHEVYKPENLKTIPQNFPLEMRTMGGSEVVMAPQRGNNLGTCSIEILTLEMNKDLWPAYSQSLLNTWMSYTDKSGKKIKTRPHWAKEWRNHTVDGKPWLHKLKEEDYKEDIVEFKEALKKIGAEQGWALKDLKARFSNDLYNELIFFDV